jgi:hypothetical protein
MIEAVILSEAYFSGVEGPAVVFYGELHGHQSQALHVEFPRDRHRRASTLVDAHES